MDEFDGVFVLSPGIQVTSAVTLTEGGAPWRDVD
jgi:hypothetical protein